MIDRYDEIIGIEKELEDRFGKMPESLKKLIEYYKIKVLATKANIRLIKEKSDGYYINFFENIIEIDKINMILLNGEAKYISKDKSIYISKEKDLKTILMKLK